MSPRQNFTKADIGAEILPILTSGLYRDTLDTIREYIQNSIDANSQHISVVIDPDVVSIIDDGMGMNRIEARRAIRLGISDKNPTINVGFRGIGIYSAFNLCESLYILTKSVQDDTAYRISFDFGAIRRKLSEEQARRANGESPELYLESLLENSVFVDDEIDVKFEKDHGTRVVMSGVVSEAYLRLNNWDEVVNYLQNVIPLPFNPDFKFGKKIAEKFEKEDYRVIPVNLQIGSRSENLYRPYTNDIFAYGGTHEPEFFYLKSKTSQYAFAWVCVNDARAVLKNDKVRGLLIKKFGFSIADRHYLEPFFGRTVYSRRITGEVIATHPDLIPNAARSDFENNIIRQEFLEALPLFTREVDAWANKIQEDDKAREVLGEVTLEINDITRKLPNAQRDREQLLRWNANLLDIERRMKPHVKRLQQIETENLKNVQTLLHGAQKFVREGLISQKKVRQQFEDEVVAAIQRKATVPIQTEQPRTGSSPSDLITLLDLFGLLESDSLRRILKYFDENHLKTLLDRETYEKMLHELHSFCEENT